MAHTDKDAPDWVRAHQNIPATEIMHTWLCENSRYSGRINPALRRACDLDNPDTRANGCRYYLRDRNRWYTGTAPTRARLHINYYGPERTAVRDSLREALREYNRYGADEFTEPDPPTRQTRRSDWYGGYWD